MKYFQLLSFLFLSTTTFCQSKVAGYYRDHFGNLIQLYSNLTFDYFLLSDSNLSWTYGKWKTHKDTIFLETIVIFDKNSIKYRDSLALQNQKNSNDFLFLSLPINNRSNFQNKISIPQKLFFKRNMIFKLDIKNNLVKKKIYVPSINAYLTPQFYSSNH